MPKINFEERLKNSKSDLVLFVAEGCGYSDAAREYAKKVGRSFGKKKLKVSVIKIGSIRDDVIKATNAELIRPLLKNKSQQVTWPQVFYKGKHLGGYDSLVKEFGL